MHRIARTLSSLFVFIVACRTAATADAPSVGSLHPKADRVSTVGTLRVERYGSGTPALILVPGLSCGSWVWDGEISAFSKTHALYVLTLAGFDGLPAAPPQTGDLLDAADRSIGTLIATEKLDRPVIVGHSLGGFLALRFGTEHSELVRGIVSVDGTPVFPPLAQSSPAERKSAGDAFAARVSGETHAEYLEGQAQTVATMVTDPAKATQTAALTSRSDQASTATYAAELFAADLRPQLPKLAVPTLEIAPVPTTPTAHEGPHAATETIDQRAAGYTTFYGALFRGAPNVWVVTIEGSRHFVMIDQPKALDDALSAFFATLPK